MQVLNAKGIAQISHQVWGIDSSSQTDICAKTGSLPHNWTAPMVEVPAKCPGILSTMSLIMERTMLRWIIMISASLQYIHSLPKTDLFPMFHTFAYVQGNRAFLLGTYFFYQAHDTGCITECELFLL